MSDLDDVELRLRSALGLGIWRFPGDVGAHIPLGERHYAELYGPAHPLWRPGWLAWSVAVERLDDYVARLGLTDTSAFGTDPDRTFTPWSGRLAATSRSRASGGIVPYLIEYDRSADLDQIFLAKHERAGHDVPVGGIRRIMTDGRRITEVAVEIEGRDVALPLPEEPTRRRNARRRLLRGPHAKRFSSCSSAPVSS